MYQRFCIIRTRNESRSASRLRSWASPVLNIADDLQTFSRLFADDTSFSCSSPNNQLIEIKLNSDLNKLQKWSQSWLVDF